MFVWISKLAILIGKGSYKSFMFLKKSLSLLDKAISISYYLKILYLEVDR
ncbi:MAG: hypothetical protein ACK4SM_03375 [Aquificaceae bacterium]